MVRKVLRQYLLVTTVIAAVSAQAQVNTAAGDALVKPVSAGRLTTEPPGYYTAAAGLTCALLKTALSTIINTGVTPKHTATSGLNI